MGAQDAATGDVIVFFDCHVSPRKGWEMAFLKQMKRKQLGDHLEHGLGIWNIQFMRITVPFNNIQNITVKCCSPSLTFKGQRPLSLSKQARSSDHRSADHHILKSRHLEGDSRWRRREGYLAEQTCYFSTSASQFSPV